MSRLVSGIVEVDGSDGYLVKELLIGGQPTAPERRADGWKTPAKEPRVEEAKEICQSLIGIRKLQSDPAYVYVVEEVLSGSIIRRVKPIYEAWYTQLRD
jgi:hypothetical protein